MPYCTNCGQQNPNINKFCIYCGTPLIQSTNVGESEAATNREPIVQPKNEVSESNSLKQADAVTTTPEPIVQPKSDIAESNSLKEADAVTSPEPIVQPKNETIENNFQEQAVPATNSEPIVQPKPMESSAQQQTVSNLNSSVTNFDLTGWLNKNKTPVIFIAGAMVALIAIYYFFLRKDPVRDARKIAATYCDCAAKSNAASIEINKDFVKSFSSQKFKSKEDARSALRELLIPINNLSAACNQQAFIKYTTTRNKYIASPKDLEKFDLTYSSQGLFGCDQDGVYKLNASNAETEVKIATIKEPEPDVQTIKSDLIGKSMPGWSFNELSEFDKFTIAGTSHGSGRIEYTIDMRLVGYRNHDPHDAKVIVAYLQSNGGWQFKDAKEVFITYTNTAPVNNWVTVTPLQNTTYTIIDNGQRFWVQDGYMGSKYKGGESDADQYYLKGYQISLMSREDHPVDVVFKYTPN